MSANKNYVDALLFFNKAKSAAEAEAVWEKISEKHKESILILFEFKKPTIKISENRPTHKTHLYWRKLQPADVLYEENGEFFTTHKENVWFPPSEASVARATLNQRAKNDLIRLPEQLIARLLID